MASHQTPGIQAPGPAAPIQADQVYQLPLSPISSEEVSGSSIEEGDSNDDSGDHTATDPDTSDNSIIDREVAAEEILTVLNNYPEISMELLEWVSTPYLRFHRKVRRPLVHSLTCCLPIIGPPFHRRAPRNAFRTLNHRRCVS